MTDFSFEVCITLKGKSISQQIFFLFAWQVKGIRKIRIEWQWKEKGGMGRVSKERQVFFFGLRNVFMNSWGERSKKWWAHLTGYVTSWCNPEFLYWSEPALLTARCWLPIAGARLKWVLHHQARPISTWHLHHTPLHIKFFAELL